MVKIALDAGHGLYTAGKRCMKALDPNETREWVLNARDFDKLERLLKEYQNVEVLRVDDVSGKVDLPLADRTSKANNWGANIYLSNHRNAGIYGGAGGGIVVYRHPESSTASQKFQQTLYNHLVIQTGLKGNRSTPLGLANFHVLRETDMPALLIEGGFMDSPVDTPIILTEAFSDDMVKGYLNFLVGVFNLQKKPVPVVVPVVVEQKDTLLPEGSFFRVVAGSFQSRNNAEEIQAKLKAAGFSSFLTVYKKE
jgi:N-acetylmuramoyl-L-alanine amidase